MALIPWTGDLRRVPFPEVLARLFREQGNGTLYCVRHSTTRTVQFETGVPCWAGSSDPDESARAWLFRRGHIALDSVGGERDRPTSEFLTSPNMREHVESHSLELVLDLFSWGEGAFIFQPSNQPPSTLLRFRASFAQLIEQGLKRVLRLSAVRTGAGTPESRVAVAKDIPMEQVLAMEEDTCLILGEITSGVHGDLSVEGWPCDYRVMLCIWQLRLLGFVRAGTGDEGVCLANLLRASSTINDLSEEHARPQEFVRPLLHAAAPPAADQATLSYTPPPPATPAPQPPPSAIPPRQSEATPPRVPAIAAAIQRDQPSLEHSPASVPPVRIHSAEPTAAIAPVQPRPLPMSPNPQADAAPGAASSVLKRARAPEPGPANENLAAMEGLMESDVNLTDMRQWSETTNARVDDMDTSDLKQMNSTAAAPASAADWFKTGERFVREMDLHNAITSFREAVNLEPNNSEYCFRLGAMLSRNPKWRKEAETHLLRAIELKGWEARYHVGLGKMYAEGGVAKKAMACFKAALEGDPDNVSAKKELKKLTDKPGTSAGGGGLMDLLSKMGKNSSEAKATVGAGADSEDED